MDELESSAAVWEPPPATERVCLSHRIVVGRFVRYGRHPPRGSGRPRLVRASPPVDGLRAHRKRIPNLGDGVGGDAPGDRTQDLVGDGPEARFERSHALRREERIDDARNAVCSGGSGLLSTWRWGDADDDAAGIVAAAITSGVSEQRDPARRTGHWTRGPVMVVDRALIGERRPPTTRSIRGSVHSRGHLRTAVAWHRTAINTCNVSRLRSRACATNDQCSMRRGDAGGAQQYRRSRGD